MQDEFRIVAESENRLVCHHPGQLIPLVFERGESDRRAFELARRTISVFNGWLSNDKADDRDTMAVIGSHLYSVLLPGDIDRAFRELWKRRMADPDPPPLRIVLEFRDDAAWLAELPWEFLYLPDAPGEIDGFFLCAQSRVILTRTVQLVPTPRKQPRDDDPIRILVVLSEPKGENTVSDELVKVLERLRSARPDRVELRLKIREGDVPGARGPTRADVKKWIGDATFPPDIVHFLGHGQYVYNKQTRLEKGALALVDPASGEADWCSDKDFADFFDRARMPKLVFLHACESGQTASYRGFKGLALSLVKRGIPNVVAMQYPVENAVADRFATTFYEAALAGEPIDAAVQAGRQELGTGLTALAAKLHPEGHEAGHFSDRRFGSPIVFVQAWQGLSVFGRAAANAAGPAVDKAGAAEDSYPCPYAGCTKQHKASAKFCDQGKGPLASCATCRHLMTGDAVVCGWCGAPRDPASTSKLATIPDRATANDPAAGRFEFPAPTLERFRAAADSAATHGSTVFTGRPQD